MGIVPNDPVFLLTATNNAKKLSDFFFSSDKAVDHRIPSNRSVLVHHRIPVTRLK